MHWQYLAVFLLSFFHFTVL